MSENRHPVVKWLNAIIPMMCIFLSNCSVLISIKFEQSCKRNGKELK